MLLVLPPNGATAWLAFTLIAGIGRRRSWWVAAAVYAVIAIAFDLVDDPVGDILQGTLYIVIVAHALIANTTWLSLLWARRENGLTISGNRQKPRPTTKRTARPRSSVSPEGERLLVESGRSRMTTSPIRTTSPMRGHTLPGRRARRPRRGSTAGLLVPVLVVVLVLVVVPGLAPGRGRARGVRVPQHPPPRYRSSRST